MNHLIRVIGDIDFQAVTHGHGEQFRQACLDEGNKPDTVAKKIRELKAMFELGFRRKQLEENPFKNVKPPKTNKNKKIHTYTEEQCDRLIREASDYQKDWVLEWDLVITLALTTAMRKSEILNAVWSDIDFKNMTIEISPKENTEYTWAWEIKDTDSRTLPLTEDVIRLLINLQERRPAGYPYVFVPPKRYDRIQLTRTGKSKRKKNTWSLKDANNSVINGFTGMFSEIKTKAGIKKGTFHDLRRTAITNFFYAGLEITEVMRLAGHSKYDTCLTYYLSVKDDLVDKARQAVKHSVSREMLEKCLGE
jgi:integrase